MTAKVRGIHNKDLDAAQLADVLKACLRDGDSVELEGLGVFLADQGGPPRFVPDTSICTGVGVLISMPSGTA